LVSESWPFVLVLTFVDDRDILTTKDYIMRERILGFFGDYRFLSNFHSQEGVKIYIDAIDGLNCNAKFVCDTIEHAFQASKTIIVEERREVAAAETPGKAKKLGRKVTLRSDWQEIKNDVMMELLVQKFTHPYYRDLLLATGDAELIEDNNWGDTYWGMCEGIGENHLGRMLMEVREVLRLC
jgi:ribA/ribD-fused uncharacterized protein